MKFTLLYKRSGCQDFIIRNPEIKILPFLNDKVMEKIIAKVPVGRLGKAEEIARAVVFLADKNAGFITGETLSVNGGLEME